MLELVCVQSLVQDGAAKQSRPPERQAQGGVSRAAACGEAGPAGQAAGGEPHQCSVSCIECDAWRFVALITTTQA